jgi:hypothetical protein
MRLALGGWDRDHHLTRSHRPGHQYLLHLWNWEVSKVFWHPLVELMTADGEVAD